VISWMPGHRRSLQPKKYDGAGIISGEMYSVFDVVYIIKLCE
jgi:hypothetical protein